MVHEARLVGCVHCGGFLRRDDDGGLACWACGRVANPPPIVPDSRWPVGGQPPPRPPLPKFGDHKAVFPPATSHPWRAESGAHWANTEAAQLDLLRRQLQAAKMREARRTAVYQERLRWWFVGRKAKGKLRVAGRGGTGV